MARNPLLDPIVSLPTSVNDEGRWLPGPRATNVQRAGATGLRCLSREPLNCCDTGMWRRVWDLNPRSPVKDLVLFKSTALGRYANPPRGKRLPATSW